MQSGTDGKMFQSPDTISVLVAPKPTPRGCETGHIRAICPLGQTSLTA